MSRFEQGNQPCNSFQQQLDGNQFAMWGNEHECPRCGGIVSFCNNCFRDHHENGWETCTPKEQTNDD